MRYRIERIRDSLAESPVYWHDGRPGAWMHHPGSATLFSEAERQGFLARELKGHPNHVFPAGGVWVRIDGEQTPALKHHFTTIKLRPVVIRLAATEGEYEDLNAQALEFEAALRQWVKKQQILTDEWSVDVITEEE